MLLWLIVVVRVLANPCSNALQKLLGSRGFAAPVLLALPHLGLTLLAVPLLVRGRPVSTAFWSWCLLSAALAVAANWLIIEAIRRADLSLLGPINSYKPVVSLLPGMLLLGERPGPASLAGIGLVLAGSLLLMDPLRGPRRPGPWLSGLTKNPGVQLRFAALLLSSGEAVTLKRALALGGSPLTFAAWAVLGFVFVVPFAVRPLARQVRDQNRPWSDANGMGLIGLTITTGLMQFCTLVTLEQLPVGVSLALFQTSTLVTVLLGHALFQEPHFQRRMAGAVVMAAGAGILVLTR